MQARTSGSQMYTGSQNALELPEAEEDGVVLEHAEEKAPEKWSPDIK